MIHFLKSWNPAHPPPFNFWRLAAPRLLTCLVSQYHARQSCLATPPLPSAKSHYGNLEFLKSWNLEILEILKSWSSWNLEILNYKNYWNLEFLQSWILEFLTTFKISRFQGFNIFRNSRIQHFKISLQIFWSNSRFQDFNNSRLKAFQDFKISRFQESYKDIFKISRLNSFNKT